MTKNTSRYSIIVCALLIGVGLTVFQIQHTPMFITDTFVYLKTAIVFQDHGFRAAMDSYGWPFYALLMAWMQQLTGLSMLAAGYIVNAFFQAWLLVSFAAVVGCFDKSTRTLLAALGLVLVYSKLNSLRPDLTRDFAYWAMLFTALWALMRFSVSARLYHGLLWGIFSFLAILFRLEGVYIAMLMPLCVWFWGGWSWRTRGIGFIKLMAVPLLVFSIAIMASGFNPDLSLGRLHSVSINIYTYWLKILMFFNTRSHAIAVHVLPALSAKYSYVMLLAGSLAIFGITLCKTLTPTFVFLTGSGLFLSDKKIGARCSHATIVLVYFLLINLAVTLSFFALRYFIVSRYLMAFALGVLVIAALNYSALIKRLQLKPWREQPIAVVFFLLVHIGLATMALQSIDRTAAKGFYTQSTPKNVHIKAAGLWLAAHLPRSETVLSNNKSIEYYAATNTRAWLKQFNLRAQTDVMALLAALNDSPPAANTWLALHFSRHALRRTQNPVDVAWIARHAKKRWVGPDNSVVYILTPETTQRLLSKR